MSNTSNKSKSNSIKGFILTENAIENKITSFVEYGNPSSVEKGQRFCKWILKYLFEQQDEEIEYETQTAGKSDNSVDAWFEDDNTLYIIQSKYNNSHSYAGMCQQFEDIERLLENPSQLVGQNKYLRDFANTLEEYLNLKNENYDVSNDTKELEEVQDDVDNIESEESCKKIEVYYITNNIISKEANEKSQQIVKKIKNKYSNICFNIYGISEIREYILKSLHELPKEYKETPKKLFLRKYFITHDTCIAEVELKQFAIFVTKNIEYLFYSNVRNYLNNSNINRKIAETFRDKNTDFWYYNNGITIICDSFSEPNELTNTIDIYAPQIVNGCQTASTIYKEYAKLKTKEEKDSKQGSILIKIIRDKNLNKRDGIILYTNSQNSVSAMDFFALDKFHKDLKVEFAKIGYNYEIQRKESEFRKDLDNVQFRHRYGKNETNKVYEYLYGKDFNYILPVKNVIQSYASGIHFMVINATSRSGNLAPGKEASKRIFNDKIKEITNGNPLYFLYPFCVMQYAKKKLGYGGTNRTIEGTEIDGIKRRRTIQTEFKKPCLMLYVSTYFRMLIRFLKGLDLGVYSRTENDDPFKIPFNILRGIFENEEINVMLLKTADSILEAYFDDSEIRKLYKDNIPKFLKNDVEKQPAVDGLNDKIDSAFENKLSDEQYYNFASFIKNLNSIDK